MMRRFFYIIALLFFLLPSEVYGQQIKHLGAYDGIRSGAVRAFQKDTLGYMWIGTSQGLNRYSGYQFKNYDKFLTSGVVDIINKNGNLFVLSSKGELLQYQYEQDRFKSILNLKYRNFLCFKQINDNTIIIGLKSGLLIYDFKSKKLSKVLYPKTLFNRQIHVKQNKVYVASTKGINVYDFFEKNNQLVKHKTLLKNIETLDFDFDKQNRIWAGTHQKGLFVIDNEKVNKVNLFGKRIKTTTIRSIVFDKYDKALIALEGLGLFIMNENFKVVNKIKYNPNSLNSLSQKSIYEIFVDNDNVYWLGLRGVGIDLIYPRDNAFKNISYVPYKSNSIPNNYIRSIYFEESGNVWFGSEKGLSKLSPEGKWTNYNKNSSHLNKPVLTINKYGEHLLLGVYGNGLLQFNPKTGETKDLPLQENEKKSKLILTTYVDENDIWVGGIDGPVKHYQNSTLVKSYKTGNARTIVAGNKNIMYVGSANGLFEINKATKSLKKIKSPGFKNLDQIYSLFFDKQNNCLWIGNTQGLFKYDFSTNDTTLLNKELNFESGTVFSIQKDANQNLWLGSYSGLWKLNTKKAIISKYDTRDGLTIETFGIGASTKSNDGRIAFGGPKGAALFNPLNLPKEKEDFKIYVSDFKVNGVVPDSTMLKKNINFLEKVELNYNQNSLSFDFETPSLYGSKKQTFSWQLKGYDEHPIISKNSRMAIYSKIPPGTYSLEAKVTNVNGVSSLETYTIDIIIKNPFWLSYWAFLGYTILGFVLLYLFVQVKKSRTQKKNNENKIKFFTEVAHDIRTPVTLIQLLVSQLSSEENKFQNSFDLIHRNTQNLNEYVTQLLDFQKADRGMLKLSVSKVDLKEILHRIVAEVEPLLKQKSIDISIAMPKTYLWFDENKMSRIFYNLISNAIKYSEEGGHIEIKASANNKTIKIDVIDYGFGVPEKEQKLIFSRFTRGTNINNKEISGSGIGLMISKKIVELHGGKIELKSKENLGATFSVILQKGSEHYNEKDILIKDKDTNKYEFIEDDINSNIRILLVDDNEDLRVTIKEELEKKYTVIDAPNGKEALLIAVAKNPDLIITDVMMPVMGGKELCNIIKTNFQTSHIPVIMITALSEVDDKMEGLEIGADAYVEKPFNMKILMATVNNLIKSRQRLNQIFNPNSDGKVKIKSADDNFLSEVVQIIKENITNSEFSIDLISEKTGLSRSNLFRKLKGLVDMSPVDLVTRIKLNHAAELLKTNKAMRISNVAYESGFNDPRYFSTLFKKTFGKTPKEYSKEN
jgi:signal transduction histidine kinase/DNA-binding response OmpR family regulator/ligand-binding sensor domain-containing protein